MPEAKKIGISEIPAPAAPKGDSDSVAAELKKRSSGPPQFEKGKGVEGDTRKDTLRKLGLPESPKR